MILEMKVPSGNLLRKLKSSLVSKDGDYVEKDQAVAEVDSDNNTRIAS
jgi:2-oxoglutarate dehydrogenase E2 component (dihydrolipoamide succinyltransferase)